MIPSTSSSDRTARPDSVSIAGPSVARQKPARTDQLSADSAVGLQAALEADPEIRPAVVARAQALAADPGYPPIAVIRNVAQQILAAPDLSEDES